MWKDLRLPPTVKIRIRYNDFKLILYQRLVFLPKNVVNGLIFFLSIFARAFCAGVILVDCYNGSETYKYHMIIFVQVMEHSL